MKNCKIVQNYIIGENSIKKLNELIGNKSKKDTIILIDDYFENNYSILENYISNNCKIIFVSTKTEPKSEYIDIIVKKIKNSFKPDLIVGIGGGTTLDIAKATSILLTNDGKAEDYQGWDLVKNKSLYKIGIPTISGTGAEFTRTAVMTSPSKKLGINSDESVFDQVILDPNLIKTVPNDKFIFTAMDCFVHNVESLRGTQNDSMTIAYAEKSLEMLKKIFKGEMDYEKLMVCSAFGGLAVANSNVGICHPLSYGLSLVLGLRHGYAITIAFNQLEEYYPEVKDFKLILEKYNICLPKIIDESVTDEQISKMADATLLNEKPLENAFGKKWKEIFTKEKVINLLKKM